MSHIAEHMAFKYRSEVEQQLGVQLTAPDAELDPNTEVQVSRLTARAAAQLLQTKQAKAQQQQAQQQAQNPEMQLKMEELKIKQATLALQQAKFQAENKLESRKLDLDQAEIAIDAQKEAAKLNFKEREVDKKLKTDMMKHMMPQ